MRMASCLICLVVSVCAGAADLEPGEHKNLQTDGLVVTSYDLFLPKAFATEPKARFPLVLLSSQVSNIGFLGLTEWADRQDVVLVSMLAGPSYEKIASQSRAVLAAVAETCRIEPALRFSFDLHGNHNGILAKSDDPEWGGFIDIMFSKASGSLSHAYVCLGVIPGPTRGDRLQQSEMNRGTAAGYRKKGIPSRFAAVPANDDAWKLNEDLHPMIDWMVQYQRLSHPRLAPAVLKAGQDRLRKRIVALLDSTDPASISEIDVLLDIELVAKSRDAAPLAKAWCGLAFAKAMAETDPMMRCRRLDSLAASERAKAMAPAERKKMLAELAVLRKDKAIRADSESRAALAIAQDTAYNRSRGSDWQESLRKSIVLMEEIGKRWPGTEAAEIAAAEITRLEKGLR